MLAAFGRCLLVPFLQALADSVGTFFVEIGHRLRDTAEAAGAGHHHPEAPQAQACDLGEAEVRKMGTDDAVPPLEARMSQHHDDFLGSHYLNQEGHPQEVSLLIKNCLTQH